MFWVCGKGPKKVSSFMISRTIEFKELIRRVSSQKQKLDEFFINENEKYYLRSLGEDERKDISDIR